MDIIPSVQIKESLHQKEEGPFRCSFCTKGFFTMQSLGGHQTIHREEIKEMRLQHQDYMLTHYKRCAKEAIGTRPLATAFGGKITTIDIPSKDDRVQMIPLSPNRAFWKAHKRLKRKPKLHDFLGISNHLASAADENFNKIQHGRLFYDETIDVELKL